MNSDQTRCPVCQCETSETVGDTWCPTRGTFYVTRRCVDHGHAWTETLAMTVHTVHENGVDRDLVFLVP